MSTETPITFGGYPIKWEDTLSKSGPKMYFIPCREWKFVEKKFSIIEPKAPRKKRGKKKRK